MTDFVPTRASLLKKDADKALMVTIFEKRKKNEKTSQNINSIEDTAPQDSAAEIREKQEKEMKRLKFQVMKFGMTGLSKDKAYKAKIELAVKLGAKPPKNKRCNYKKLLEKKKQEEDEKKKLTFSGFDASMLNCKKYKKNNKSSQNKDKGILGSYGKVKKSGKK